MHQQHKMDGVRIVISGLLAGRGMKLGLALMPYAMIAMIVFFGWRYVGVVNDENLTLAVSVSELSDQIVRDNAEIDRRESVVNAFADAFEDMRNERDKIENDRATLESEINEIQFAKNFERWAMVDPDRLDDCMQSSINRLLANLEAATGNQIPEHENTLSCTADAATDNHPQTLAPSD